MNDLKPSDREEIELLLPWYANGTLDEETARRVAEAVARDERLAGSLKHILEDAEATRAVADLQPLPDGMEARFRAALAAERRSAAMMVQRDKSPRPHWWERVGQWLTPPRLAFAATVAGLVIAIQAAALALLMLGSIPGGEGHRVASEGPAPGPVAGPEFLVQPEQTAGIAEISAFLEELDGRIVDGPLPGGLLRLRFAGADAADAETIEAALTNRTDLFVLVLPAGQPDGE
jgi:hypothetical protein